MRKTLVLTALILTGIFVPGNIGTKSAQAHNSAYKLTVLRTAYCLSGHTRTGRSVGYGIVAVDPYVIPMHTHMWIPGYGSGYAEDTGSAVKGRHIDVWVSSCSKAMTMTRTVTITVYR